MSRFFIPPDSINGEEAVVRGAEARHIVNVMRLSVLDEVVFFDGTGVEYRGVIRQARPHEVTIAIASSVKKGRDGAWRVTLIQAVPKKEKMDYIAEKATELGVDRLIPVSTCRTIPHWDAGKAAAHAARWRKLAREAAKQCGRCDVPVIEDVCPFAEALLTAAAGSPARFIAALCDDARPLRDAIRGGAPRDTVIAIGPEGDFTSAEVHAAFASGFQPVSLGRRILKSDTAGLAALAILDYEYAR